MASDFSGQRLRGRSFRGQDLTGADFSRSDLRGCDFTDAQLAGANFAGAKAGLVPLRRVMGLAILALGALMSGGLAYGLARVAGILLRSETVAEAGTALLGVGLLAFLLLVALRSGQESLNRLLLQLLVGLTILISMILGGYGDWGLGLALAALALALAAGLAQGVAVLVAAAEVIEGPILVPRGSANAGCAVGAIAIAAAVGAAQLAQSVWFPGVGAVVLGVVMAWRALAGDERYELVRDWAVAIGAIGGTSFRRARLTDADFSRAQLTNCDLRRAILTRARFCEANLDSTWVGRSILNNRQVRQLLVTGNGHQQSLAELNLAGANLQDADLRGADLRDVNLVEATLQGANLEGASLVRTNAIGADFRQAQLTGACIVDWNIDSATQLDGVDCRYVFRSILARQFGSRLPAQGDWHIGEFSYQFAVSDRDGGNLFASESLALMDQTAVINPQEILASLMVLVRLAIADAELEETERNLLVEALKALQLPIDITLDRVLDDRTSSDELLAKINSPIIREKVYQSAYLMARIDGELETEEEALLDRIQSKLTLSSGKVESLQSLVTETQNLSIVEQVEAIVDSDARSAAVDMNIRVMSLMHAMSGAMPIPGFAIVTHLMIYKDQVELVQKIARIWGYSAEHKFEELDRAIFGSMGATAARVALSNVVLLIPVWGSVIGASTAFSMTWAIGELTKRFFASGGQLDEASLAEQFADAKLLGQKAFEESQEFIEAKQQELGLVLEELQVRLTSGAIGPQDYVAELRDAVRRLL
jgi:uncharacterized protein YjbI with pentapeptide repeats/uncharacterized protein (DUF697 family)